jgi:hypothetical protein
VDATCRDEFADCARRTGIRKKGRGRVCPNTHPTDATTHHLGECVITDYKTPKKTEWHDSAPVLNRWKCHVHRVRLLTNQERDTRQLGKISATGRYGKNRSFCDA